MRRALWAAAVLLAWLPPLSLSYQGQTGSGWDFQEDRQNRRQLIAKGQKWMAKKAEQFGVRKLGTNGLLYEVLENGKAADDDADSASPGERASCEVRYVAKDLKGRVVAQTKGRKPTVMAVNRVIKGLREALPQMCTGDRWRLYVPYDLAYGTRAEQPDAATGERPFSLKFGAAQPPGYSPLEIEVHLLKVKEGGKSCARRAGEL
eukprot:TRINITY_DN56368_c0_g1_i1.p1 TRINITY_DN56368_c0_g1~~TRINITY_DN56368_c0_g1_i1.p1  ORF type:complete len:229 (+),score=74.59 TRINITY_DN56368_c0_g1_i1:74-688(+)